MRRIFEFLISFLLIASIVFPSGLVEIKLVLFLGALFFALSLGMNEGFIIGDKSIIFWIGYPILGLAWSLYGIAMGNPGAVRVLSVMFFYPLIFPIFAFCYKSSYNEKLFRVFKISAWVVVIFDLLYITAMILNEATIVNIVEGIFKNQMYSVTDAEDYFKFTLPNISSLLFLIPCIVVSVMFGYTRIKIYDGVLIFLMLLVGVLSGRRALFVTAGMGPLLAYVMTFGTTQHNKLSFVHRSRSRWIILFALFIAMLWFFHVFERSDYYIDQLFSVFDFSENTSNIERRMQFYALLEGWGNSPIFGAGAGAAAEYSRSIEQPWAYELSYVAFLFQYGIIGFLLYAGGICFIVYRLRQIILLRGRKSFHFCVLAGFISFLIANATNPYLAKFDYMWVIFLPFALINIRMDG